jgi:hypothetical protein
MPDTKFTKAKMTSTKGTMAHEIGHQVHDYSSKMTTTINTWFAERTKGSGTSLIYKGTTEYGYKDKFIDHYIGKVYNRPGRQTGTEVFSMGMTYMQESPKYFYAKDKGMFDLIYGLMQGLVMP